MNRQVEKAKLIIAKKFREGLSLNDLSEEVGLSKFHFQRLFKKETGSTPSNYINTVRLEHASHMIKMYPQANLTDIAFETGFSSPSVFSRSFKNKFNSSPVAYKKKLYVNYCLPSKSKSNNLPICYMDGKTIQVEASNLLIENLNSGLKRVISDEEYAGKIYGIFMDAPMHKKLEESRYYFGSEQSSDHQQLCYVIDSGYYTYLNIKGDFQQVIKMIVDFKENFIDPSPYEIESLIGFEIINFNSEPREFDYFLVSRRLYIKVKRR